MGERPILFSAPMVRALLAGTKTQTRRVLKPQPHADCGQMHVDIYHPTVIDRFGEEQPGKATFGTFSDDGAFATPIRIQRGDRLWVRESGHLLREAYDHDPRQGEDLWRDAGFQHSADGEIVSARPYDPPLREWVDDCARISRPSIHMPRWASRLTLTVTDVRVQRLQDISEDDAIDEGLTPAGIAGWVVPELGDDSAELNPVAVYRALWEHINGAGSWDANPWCAAYTFTVERRNIDASPMSDPTALVAELRAGKVGPLPDGWDMGHYEEAVQRLLDRAADLIAQQAATIAAAADEIERLKILVAGSEAERYRVCGELVTRTTTAEEALSEIIAREDKAWKPVRVFRSEHESEMDDARHEAWTEAADIARAALSTAEGLGE